MYERDYFEMLHNFGISMKRFGFSQDGNRRINFYFKSLEPLSQVYLVLLSYFAPQIPKAENVRSAVIS